MNDGHPPDDLRWPPPSTEREPFELLEIVRDETGREQWRRDQGALEAPEPYREWLPKRLRRDAAVEHDELDLFPSATSAPEPEHQPAPIMAAPVIVAAATETVANLPTAVVTQPDPVPAPHVGAPTTAPALRRSLMSASPVPRPAPSPVNRTALVTAERVGLLAAGAVMGVIVTLIGLRVATSNRAEDAPAPGALARDTTAPPPAETVPAPARLRRDDAPVVPAASVAMAAAPPTAVAPPAPTKRPAVAATPAQAASAPLQERRTPNVERRRDRRALPAVAAPVPAQVETTRASTRPAAPVGRPAAGERRRQTSAAPKAASAARLPRPALSEGPAVLGTVEQYAAAYSRLDARATQALWPSVDRQALVGTFTGIREQRLTLTSCKATVAADRAAVTCRGTLRYRPRVGEHSTRTEQGRWTFDLDRRDQAWVIADVGRP